MACALSTLTHVNLDDGPSKGQDPSRNKLDRQEPC